MAHEVSDLWSRKAPLFRALSKDEGYDQAPVGIGTDELRETATIYTANDRVLYEWQKFAGSWDEKTVNAKLTSIRQFEVFVQGKPFNKLTTTDVSKFREHLKSFFGWLVDQKGYQGLNKSLPDHFKLPKKSEANGLVQSDRAIPRDEDTFAMVTRMAADTPKARRDRAMVAIASLSALRADTITSLRVKHIEPAKRITVQDAAVARTKNGKSLRIKWFPLPSIFADVVVNWLNELIDLGFYKDDALFPEERNLHRQGASPQEDRIPVMASTHAVSFAFRIASVTIGKKFSPHSAKHHIGALGMRPCKNVQDEAAWSANMGHEGMEITRRFYQKPSQADIDDVFERFDQDEDADTSTGDMELMLRYNEHTRPSYRQLCPGQTTLPMRVAVAL